ncbi:MAG: hypothetical protein Q9218_003466 [Villophora microphyllina]
MFINFRCLMAWLMEPSVHKDDGLCAIDIALDEAKIAEQGDVSSNLGISRAAKAVIDTCVSPLSRGGQQSNFTPLGNLMVTVRRYDTKVDCGTTRGNLPDVGDCTRVLQTMPASTGTAIFHRDKRAGAVKVPWNLDIHGDQRSHCTIDLRLARSTDNWATTAWFEIFAAGVAIMEVCVRDGRTGTALVAMERLRVSLI